MIQRLSVAAMLLLATTTASADDCEASFAKKGNPVTGLRFTATTTVKDMSPSSAVGQLRGIVLPKGYDILAAEPEAGEMLIEQPATGKARSFPVTIAITDENGAGKVTMDAKLRPTMNIPDAAARSEMCGMLNQLRGGQAGLALARKGNAAQAIAAPPLCMSVLAFSSQLAGEARKNSEAMVARHQGKSFTLFGPVGTVGKAGNRHRIDFKLVENALTSIVPGSGYRLNVSCILAEGQSAYSLKLQPDKHVELTGVFDEYDMARSTLYLRDCRPA